MWKKYGTLLAVLILFCVFLQAEIQKYVIMQKLPDFVCETDAFRNMSISGEVYTDAVKKSELYDCDPFELMAAAAVQTDFSAVKLPEAEKLMHIRNTLSKRKTKNWKQLVEALRMVWNDIECFPVGSVGNAESCSYENSWGNPRSYGGKRSHEGCDIFAGNGQRGIIPILSMTDGWVENVGWLPLGGYRLGIRSQHGTYFYYAHLDSYSREFRPGDKIRAGDLLGFMGDTGYGEEGTRGKFAVHLHLGIYIRTPHQKELSVNPYEILRYSQFLQRE